MEDTHSYNVKISRLEEEIRRFDCILDRIQKLMPEDMRVYNDIVQARDAIFRLQQIMHGCETVEFAAPWIEPADIFWDKDKQRAFGSEEYEGLQEDEL